jgi:hypothetical protein
MSVTTALSWQANLLDETLRATQRRRSSWPIVPAIVTGLVIASALHWLASARSDIASLAQRAQASEQRFKEVEKHWHAGAGNSAAATHQASESLEQEVANKRALIAVLQQALTSADNSWTAYSVLSSLSDRHRDGLWLTQIRIDRLRREIVLEGQATDAESISAYVAGLGARGSALARMSVSSVTSELAETGAAAADDARAGHRLRFKLQSTSPRP